MYNLPRSRMCTRCRIEPVYTGVTPPADPSDCFWQLPAFPGRLSLLSGIPSEMFGALRRPRTRRLFIRAPSGANRPIGDPQTIARPADLFALNHELLRRGEDFVTRK